ncbi:MAG: hypothetical protein CM1200mP40_30580 [Gammaproteobacteria bacterium]|nr:MAG: hypothetical protein CM1200mP40_30580 [Gammaproteobacteria bacterium]
MFTRFFLDSPVFQDDQVEEVRAPISPILQPPVDAQPAQSSINQTLELASEEPEPVLELEPVEPETITTSDADTLSDIAERVRPNTSVSIQQTMLAIQELNPNAFIDGNINQMRRVRYCAFLHLVKFRLLMPVRR